MRFESELTGERIYHTYLYNNDTAARYKHFGLKLICHINVKVIQDR